MTMPDPTALATLLTRYQTLCQYCDDVFAATQTALRQAMQCAPGCASCCVLETVVPLEASIIRTFLAGTVLPPRPNAAPGVCVFLREQRCVIYPVRPIICRTHGLPLAYQETQTIETCPLNFTDLDLTTVEPAYLLDAEVLTANLLRLNLAFCLLTGEPDRAAARVTLQSLLDADSPR